MAVDTTQRSTAPEIMDDFTLQGELLRDALDKIAAINKLLGGNQVTLNGVKALLKNKPKNQRIRIIDIGCGNGDMLRILADYAIRNQLNFELTGVDANQFTVNHAKQLSKAYTNITIECRDIFQNLDQNREFDIFICTLTLHHFRDEEILTLMENIKSSAQIGIVINDLERSAVAYRLFAVLCFIFGLNHMSKQDGLVSILRGFKRTDLERYSEKLRIKHSSIKWKWAFRYQWIIQSI